ncbi:SDR family oxidoreductase [Mangrovimonas sp. AS39]|uniref:SDR family oxidoreductase n=1 Tax=Mangrovimonas futianensis TaxID=2895523 RepID=UPI001E614F63|nr:SDR family oxidoreductase [Mangrovimonas futianensis]MCF1191547.1 SDR family oxidoreductase [Mangrovimonas futianensis]MCF1195565.1 SDR family oxidoreductase [Mangrovimonas futianensis]
MILITGASGHLGAAVVNELLNRVEASQLAVLSRNVEKVNKFKELGVEVRQGDYDDYDSLVKAFKGVDSLYFVSGNDIASRMQQHENVVKAAKEAGVKHIVYTSFQRQTDELDSIIQFVAESHIKTEDLIKESGIPYTILKHGLYLEVLPLFIGDTILETQTVFLPADDGKVSFASRADMAQGAAIILSTSGHEGKTYEFGGEVSYGMKNVAEILSKLSGKDISYISPTIEDFVNALSEAGVPQGAIDVTVGFSQGIAAGEFDQPTTTLKDILGHELLSLSTFLEATFIGE